MLGHNPDVLGLASSVVPRQLMNLYLRDQLAPAGCPVRGIIALQRPGPQQNDASWIRLRPIIHQDAAESHVSKTPLGIIERWAWNPQRFRRSPQQAQEVRPRRPQT
jgi:hypothetical protein